MSAQHTKEPWTVNELYASGEKSDEYIFIEPGVAVIERKIKGSEECDMADALLIAAAPDLLKQLQHVVRFFDQLNPSDIERYLAVIAKATGSAT